MTGSHTPSTGAETTEATEAATMTTEAATMTTAADTVGDMATGRTEAGADTTTGSIMAATAAE